jgi:cellulose synthase/poly-beta-1,6-N-acetylglucosamine synthase-like glycosyltransferase
MNIVLFNIYLIMQIAAMVMLALATLYLLVFAVAGISYRQPELPASKISRKIAVLIPGYKEDEVIVEVAMDALKQEYPTEHYDVVVIADSFRAETLENLRALPIKVIEVKFEKSTKSKALNKAMEQLPDDYDIAVVLDADNLMAPDFLTKINVAFGAGYSAVQGHRTAKNMNTSLAVLDAVSEEINNHIFRKGHRMLGLSSAIIGSGMAFGYSFFKDMMINIKAIGGFDKEIELKMLKDGHTIGYLDDAIVYDEKVQKAEVFSNQRRRWLSAQLHYFRQDFFSSLKALLTKGNIDYFDKAIQFIQPPRVLLLGAVTILTVVFSLINLFAGIAHSLTYLWLILFLACILAFAFSVPRVFWNIKTLKALASLPKGMLLMMGSLMRIKGANKQFIHTQHTTIKSEKPDRKI